MNIKYNYFQCNRLYEITLEKTSLIIKVSNIEYSPQHKDWIIKYIIIAKSNRHPFPYGETLLKRIIEKKDIKINDIPLYINWHKTFHFSNIFTSITKE